MNLEEFRNHLAENLGIKGDGNALSADRANYLETLIENCHAELEQLEVALWPSSDIPAYAVESSLTTARPACRGLAWIAIRASRQRRSWSFVT